MNSSRKVLMGVVAAVIFGGCLGSGVSSSNPPSPPSPTASATATAVPTVVGTLIVTEFFDEMGARRHPLCTLDVEEDIGAGSVQLTVLNETDGSAVVEIWRIADGHTFREFQAHSAREQEPHTWADGVISITLAPSESATQEWTVRAGTHGIACIWNDEHAQWSTGIAVVGPVEVK